MGNDVSFFFHGSAVSNFFSIMRNGLKISSNTKLMTAGAAYGNGIYLSDSFAFSLPYCRATRGKGIMAICQVQGEHEKWKKEQMYMFVTMKNLLSFVT